jgi:hypothetical protein
VYQEISHGGGVGLFESVLHQETSHGGGGGLLESVLHQETSHGGGGLLESVLHQETSHGGGLLEGVLHQETSHGGGGGLLVHQNNLNAKPPPFQVSPHLHHGWSLGATTTMAGLLVQNTFK